MKKTPNQIREELRRQLAQKHSEDLENLRQEKKRVWDMFNKSEEKRKELARENDELKEKLKQVEDWNSRLMEFMDIPENDRQEYVENLKIKLAEENKFNALLDVYSELFKCWF